MMQMNNAALRKQLSLYFIMGSNNCEKDPVFVLQEAIRGGITLFQFREKGHTALAGAAKFDLAKKLQEVCKQHNIPFIVNDDVDLAIALDADGVHVGQEDESAKEVRQRIGDKILGVSAYTVDEARKAIEHGADYLGVGPIFSTSTKEDAKAAQGPEAIQVMRQKGIHIPIVGIGGIDSHNASLVIDSGADGVSVISAISLATDTYEASVKLKRAVSKGE
ncbi:thiamine phosphate synthase [Brevibacillus sp. SYSU BS000544]|uniref:thiamine phosphate synthase n=1 Tax=Brevibacillus sp. SYSU BS000544 TaxID=3416443 RepID=UPI003CE4C101